MHIPAAIAPPSPKFGMLSVRSELRRIGAMSGVCVAAVVVAALRNLASGGHPGLGWKQGVYMIVPLVYGPILYVAVRTLGRDGRAMPAWLRALDLAFDCAVPMGFIALLWLSATLPAEVALVSPAMLAAAVILSVGTLRLNPAMSVGTGVVMALEHASMVLLAQRRGALEHSDITLTVLLSYSAWLVIAGAVAGFVARELRTHVSALLEQTNRRERAEHEISVAAEVQQGLLPSAPPQVAGYSIAFWNRPAGKTGGDYYDWQLLPDGRLAISLADVSGHGLGPALMAAFCRAYARATMNGAGGLSAAVSRVNELIAGDLPPGRFVTFVVALITPGSGEVQLVSAGHGPILVHRAGEGRVDSMGAGGLPLGVEPGAPFDAAAIPELRPGDAVVLVTDGFFEWAGPNGDMFGVDRLSRTLCEVADEPEQTIRRMLADVEAFASGTEQVDDLTAVVIRRTA